MQKLYFIIFCLSFLIFANNVQADPISDFAKCVDGGKSETECYRSEAQRYVGKIQDMYNQYAKDSFFDDFKVDKTQTNSEKFRKLMNMWKMYAQNYCNLVNYTSAKSGYDDEDRNKCLYDLSVRQFHEIEAIESIRQSDTF